MGSKFRLNIDNYQYFWNFCSSLTNYHISKNPLRDFEREVYLKDDDDDDVYQYDEEEEEFIEAYDEEESPGIIN